MITPKNYTTDNFVLDWIDLFCKLQHEPSMSEMADFLRTDECHCERLRRMAYSEGKFERVSHGRYRVPGMRIVPASIPSLNDTRGGRTGVVLDKSAASEVKRLTERLNLAADR